MDTISAAAIKALNNLRKPSSISEIYAEIIKNKFYVFNTQTPEHVLRTTIRRHTENIERVDLHDDVFFKVHEGEIYSLLENSKQRKGSLMPSANRRIHRASDKEQLIKRLTSENDIFKEIWRLLIFASKVGWGNCKRAPLKSFDSGKGIDQTTFGNCAAWSGLVLLMSIAENNSEKYLSGDYIIDQERITIFEEFANGGLEIMGEYFLHKTANLDGILEFIASLSGNSNSNSVIDLDIKF
jgi:dnd system-associated protein 4